MRRTVGPALLLLLLTGCTTTVQGIATPGPAVTHPDDSVAAAPSLPGGASPSCVRLVADGCGSDPGSPDGDGAPRVALACAPLPEAVESFDATATAVVPGWRTGAGDPGQRRALADVVAGVVDACGYQVMIDVADQYSGAVSYELLVDANTALGTLLLEPEGLRCADLRDRGYGVKDAVDYWFLWGAPALMDADLNGVPCETVFADVARYMPAYR